MNKMVVTSLMFVAFVLSLSIKSVAADENTIARLVGTVAVTTPPSVLQRLMPFLSGDTTSKKAFMTDDNRLLIIDGKDLMIFNKITDKTGEISLGAPIKKISFDGFYISGEPTLTSSEDLQNQAMYLNDSCSATLSQGLTKLDNRSILMLASICQ